MLAARAREQLPALRAASTWGEVEAALGASGLRAERRGGGLVFTDGSAEIKASAVARDLSLGALERRLGVPYPDRLSAPNGGERSGQRTTARIEPNVPPSAPSIPGVASPPSPAVEGIARELALYERRIALTAEQLQAAVALSAARVRAAQFDAAVERADSVARRVPLVAHRAHLPRPREVVHSRSSPHPFDADERHRSQPILHARAPRVDAIVDWAQVRWPPPQHARRYVSASLDGELAEAHPRLRGLPEDTAQRLRELVFQPAHPHGGERHRQRPFGVEQCLPVYRRVGRRPARPSLIRPVPQTEHARALDGPKRPELLRHLAEPPRRLLCPVTLGCGPEHSLRAGGITVDRGQPLA
jgi:hypothetical protein